MSEALREAARQALVERGLVELSQAGASGDVTRLTIDVAVDGKSEMVTLALRDGKLVWSSTGEADGPHVWAALRWLAADAEERTSAPGVRTTDTGELPTPRVSLPPPGADPEGAAEVGDARLRLADALEDVVTVITRAGAGEATSPSVTESLERLRKEASQPLASGLSRWLGRLRMALDAKDVALTARLLDGASRLADALRKDRPTRTARRRMVGWLAASGDGIVERLSDRVLVEVAREHLSSDERGGIERRYLVDLHNGEVYREERSRTVTVASVGPCPRLVHVGLAEVEDGAAPRRIRLMQYTVSLDCKDEDLSRIGQSAYRRFPALVDRYRAWVQADPGLAEPFAIVAPKRWGENGQTVCFDDEGIPLAFARADDPAAVAVLARHAASTPRWVAGRLVDIEGVLLMVPCAVAIADGEGTKLVRLR